SHLLTSRARFTTTSQLKQANSIAKVVCVQNHYNLVHRDDDTLIDELAGSVFNLDQCPPLIQRVFMACFSFAGVAAVPSRVATSDRVEDWSGVKPPSGKNGA